MFRTCLIALAALVLSLNVAEAQTYAACAHGRSAYQTDVASPRPCEDLLLHPRWIVPPPITTAMVPPPIYTPVVRPVIAFPVVPGPAVGWAYPR